MKRYTQEQLNEILKNHQHWINQDCENWGDMRANLNDVDLRENNLKRVDLYRATLRGANLQGVNLYGAILAGADLTGADLESANLESAILCRANLVDTNLSHAWLNRADLSSANLSRAKLNCASLVDANLSSGNLFDVNLSNTNLYFTNLSHAYLYCTNLSHANMSCTNLSYAQLCDADFHYTDLCQVNIIGANLNYAKNMPFIPYACPDTGSFIGYKKAGNFIIKLEIPSDAKRCSGTGRKCRCDKAKVLSIQYIDEYISCDYKEIASDYDKNFIYRVGETVEEPNFNENRWVECAKGIHFFINRQEAVEYRC